MYYDNNIGILQNRRRNKFARTEYGWLINTATQTCCYSRWQHQKITCILGIDVCNMEVTETAYDIKTQKDWEAFFFFLIDGLLVVEHKTFLVHRDRVVPLAVQSRVIRDALYIKLAYDFKYIWYAERIIIVPMFLSTTCMVSKILHKVSKITKAKEDISNNIYSSSAWKCHIVCKCMRSVIVADGTDDYFGRACAYKVD